MSRKAMRKKAKLPRIKKNVKDFLLSEEGKVSKKNIAKLGISLTALGMALRPESAQAQHMSLLLPENHTSSHANHGAHGSGGWC